MRGSVEKNFALQLGSNKTCNDNGTNTCTRGAGGFSGMPPIVLGNLQAYNAKVDTLKIWWKNRITFIQQEIDKMNIDTTKDVPDYPTSAAPSVRQPSRHLAGVTVIKNGLTVNAANSANVSIFSLTGNVVRRQSFASGSHSVRIGDLPQGMYLARVDLDGVRKMVRVAVK